MKLITTGASRLHSSLSCTSTHSILVPMGIPDLTTSRFAWDFPLLKITVDATGQLYCCQLTHLRSKGQKISWTVWIREICTCNTNGWCNNAVGLTSSWILPINSFSTAWEWSCLLSLSSFHTIRTWIELTTKEVKLQTYYQCIVHYRWNVTSPGPEFL